MASKHAMDGKPEEQDRATSEEDKTEEKAKATSKEDMTEEKARATSKEDKKGTSKENNQEQ